MTIFYGESETGLLKIFGFALVLALAVVAMGIKALTPAGIQLTETTKLNRKASVCIGIITIALGIGIAVGGFVVLILPYIGRL